MYRSLLPLLALLVVPLLGACSTLGEVYDGDGRRPTEGRRTGTRYPDRYPDSRTPERYPDRYPEARYPDARHPDRAVAVVRRDVRDYTDFLDRRLRLSERQERQIRRLLEDRTVRLLDEARRPERVYPFPRSFYDERPVVRWWHDTDRAVERLLEPDQRRVHRRLFEPGAHGKVKPHRKGNGKHRRHRDRDHDRYERYEDDRDDRDDDDDDDDD